MRTDVNSDLENNLLNAYGPLMGGTDLMKSLGYRTHSAFRRAERLGLLGVRVFPIPERKGRFALTRDVARWLTSISVSES